MKSSLVLVEMFAGMVLDQRAPLLKRRMTFLLLRRNLFYESHPLFYLSGLVQLLGRDKALFWSIYLKVLLKNYHQEVFEGYACRKMLKNSDKIMDLYEQKLKLQPFVSILKAFNLVLEERLFQTTLAKIFLLSGQC